MLSSLRRVCVVESRPAQVFALLLAFGAITTARAAAAEPASAPANSARAEVPLVKVGQFTMREPRYAAAAVARGNYLYIIGGLNRPGHSSATIERIDVESGQSEVFAELHIPRFWHRAVIIGEKIFVLGGSALGRPLPRDPKSAEAAAKRQQGVAWATGSSSPIDSVEVVDLNTRAVSHGVPLHARLSNFAAVAVADQIAVIGGRVLVPPLDFSAGLSVFEPAKNRWLAGPSMRTHRSDAGAVVTGPFVIVPGGFDGERAVDDVEVHDLRTGKWRNVRALCRPSSSAMTVLLDKAIYLFGGYDRPEELIAYDLATETSRAFTLNYNAGRHAAAVVIGRKIYAVGGQASRNASPLDVVQVFALRKDLKAEEPAR